jgi:hypothetical protein
MHISGWFTSLTDLEICTLALCATIIVSTVGAVFVVMSVIVGVIENSTKRLIHAAWHGPNNAGIACSLVSLPLRAREAPHGLPRSMSRQSN